MLIFLSPYHINNKTFLLPVLSKTLIIIFYWTFNHIIIKSLFLKWVIVTQPPTTNPSKPCSSSIEKLERKIMALFLRMRTIKILSFLRKSLLSIKTNLTKNLRGSRNYRKKNLRKIGSILSRYLLNNSITFAPILTKSMPYINIPLSLLRIKSLLDPKKKNISRSANCGVSCNLVPMDSILPNLHFPSIQSTCLWCLME